MENWQKQEVISLWIWLGIALALFFFFIIWILIRVYLKKMRVEALKMHKKELNHQQELLQKSVEIQERERKRIAANIHDDLIAQLHQIKLYNSDKGINIRLNESIKTARIISHDLIPPLLQELPFKTLMHDLLLVYSKKYEVDIRTSLEEEETLSPELKLDLYRIAQEVITNIIKHAYAASIKVHYRYSKHFIALKIMDDGVGIKTSAKNGLGMKTIELRSQLINGAFRFRNNQSGGTTFILAINCKTKTEIII